MYYLIIYIENEKGFLSLYKNNLDFHFSKEQNEALHFNSAVMEKFFDIVNAMCQKYGNIEIRRVRG